MESWALEFFGSALSIVLVLAAGVDVGVRGGGGGVVAAAAAAGGGAVAEAVDAQTGPRKATAAHHESKSAPPSTCLRHSMFAQNP